MITPMEAEKKYLEFWEDKKEQIEAIIDAKITEAVEQGSFETELSSWTFAQVEGDNANIFNYAIYLCKHNGFTIINGLNGCYISWIS